MNYPIATAARLGTLGRALLWLLAACWGTAQAHPMPESRVWIDTAPWGLVLTLQLPLDRLEIAYGKPLAAEPAAVLPRHGDDLLRYLLQHVGARSGERPWHVQAGLLEVAGQAGAAELQATLELRAPPGADPRSLTLLYDVVTHEIRTHRVLVSLRNDWTGGHVGQPPVLLGQLRNERRTLAIALAQPQAQSNFARLVQAGAQHIAEGTDHMLFLLLLVIVAPLRARAGRWAEVRPAASAARRLASVVSAFTLGHSVTLALGSMGVLTLPSRPVEVAVAASIVLAAWHALRPLVGGAEVLMALGFGLVHGLAFSASLSGAGLTAWQHTQALLAFNLGIEAMQLGVLAAALPPLLVLAHGVPALYAWIRAGTALAAALVASLWMAERAGAGVQWAAERVEAAAGQAPVAAVLLWLVAAASVWRSHQRQRAMGGSGP